MAFGAFAARHPSVIGGGAAFVVVFSFVAANALWYQPSGHPSPIMKTRSAHGPSLGFSALRQPPGDVTTFVIEREGEEGAADADQAALPAKADGLVFDIQTELTRQGFYSGDPDGTVGVQTSDAIRRFQQQRGLEVTGEPSAALLAALYTGAPEEQVAVLPSERPVEDVATADAGVALDPIAAAIRAAETNPETAPVSRPVASSALVMKIQKGLSNIAYADITVDGVAGDQTRQAIRAFEKHYRLPATGEPNELVLNKLKEIGAL